MNPKISSFNGRFYIFYYMSKEHKQKSNALYLWNDLTWNTSTGSDYSNPGYYKTRAEAREALYAWHRKTIKTIVVIKTLPC